MRSSAEAWVVTHERALDWFHHHPVIGNKEIQEAMTLPASMRDAVVEELHRRYGNSYIERGLKGDLPQYGQATPDPEPTPAISVYDYWKKYGPMTMLTAVARATVECRVEVVGPGVSLPGSMAPAFLLSALGSHIGQSEFHAVAEFLATPLADLIDGVRIIDEYGLGPDHFEASVVDRIVERIAGEVH